MRGADGHVHAAVRRDDGQLRADSRSGRDIDAQPTAVDPSCTGEVRTSEDNCDVTLVDVTCAEPGIGEGVTSTANGKAQWSRDGGTGDGTVNVVVRDFDGVVLCQSSYEVAYDRI